MSIPTNNPAIPLAPSSIYNADFINNVGSFNIIWQLSTAFSALGYLNLMNRTIRNYKASRPKPTVATTAISSNTTLIRGGDASPHIVGIVGTDPGLSTIATVTSVAQTGILGVAVLNAALLTSSTTAGDYWVVQTDGQYFDSTITGATVVAPVYYNASGVATLTAASNVRFGTIVFLI